MAGLSKGMSLEDIAKKHKVDIDALKKELKIGIEKEGEEHTNDIKKATRIAMDHLVEDPKYYTKLSKLNLEIKVKIYPGGQGADVDYDEVEFGKMPTSDIPLDMLLLNEPASKMLEPKSKATLKDLIKAIKAGKELPPIIVRELGNKYQIVDGHHRYFAHKLLGKDKIKAIIVDPQDVEILKEYSNKLINDLTIKFKKENPSLSDNDIKTYINRFDSIKGNLPADKRDITKYSWDNLEQIIASNQPKRIKAGKINDGEPEDANLVYNQDNLRVYIGKTKQACIKYGNGYSFCISARGEDNLYGDYRFMQQGTPYFIFDDSKSSERNEDGKFKDPNHLLVIFYHIGTDPDGNDDMYTVTDANNENTDEFYSWDEIIQFYPGQSKLKKLQNLIKPVELDQKEKAEYNLETESNSKIHDLNFVKYKDKEDFAYKLRTNEYYRISDINQANKYIDKILNNQLIPYTFSAILKSDDDQEKYATDMIGQNHLVPPGNLESVYKKFIEDNIPKLAMGSYSPDLETIKDEWEISYEKLNTDNKDYVTYLNDIKQVVDEYRKGLTKVKLMKENLNKSLVSEFMKHVMDELHLEKLPKITMSNDSQEAIDLRSWGGYRPSTKSIHIITAKRHPADIFRTLAHELVHYKQDLENRLKPGSGETGSDDENEANSRAAVIMRNFAQAKPNLFEHLTKEGEYGNYLFGDKESGVKIGWYKDEVEVDTTTEKVLFNFLKKYADSEANVYSTVNLDPYLEVFKKLKTEYPEIVDSNLSPNTYIYRGTVISEEKAAALFNNPNKEETKDNIIIPNQEYSSRRKISSWSTRYFPAASFAMSTAERGGEGVPVVMRAKAEDAELFFNPKFMDKLSDQFEDEVINAANPIKVDIMLIKNYEDEFEDIESGYLSTK